MPMDEAAIAATHDAREVKGERAAYAKVEGTGIGREFKEWKPLYAFFDLNEKPRHDEALSKIWAYAKKLSPLPGKEAVLWEVQKLINKVGSPSLGDLPYAKLEIYVEAWQRAQDAEEQIKEMERG